MRLALGWRCPEMSLFRTSGGKTCSKRLPSDAEGLALAVGTAMQWAKLRDCSNPQFFLNIASACKRLKCTPSMWTHEEMTYFTTEKVFNSIPQKGIERYLSRKWIGVRGASNMLPLFKDFVESIMYKYLATVDAGADYDSALELATVCLEDSNHGSHCRPLRTASAVRSGPRTIHVGGEARAGAPEPGPWRQG